MIADPSRFLCIVKRDSPRLPPLQPTTVFFITQHDAMSGYGSSAHGKLQLKKKRKKKLHVQLSHRKSNGCQPSCDNSPYQERAIRFKILPSDNRSFPAPKIADDKRRKPVRNREKTIFRTERQVKKKKNISFPGRSRRRNDAQN